MNAWANKSLGRRDKIKKERKTAANDELLWILSVNNILR